jgi:hypothetical protein
MRSRIAVLFVLSFLCLLWVSVEAEAKPHHKKMTGGRLETFAFNTTVEGPSGGEPASGLLLARVPIGTPKRGYPWLIENVSTQWTNVESSTAPDETIHTYFNVVESLRVGGQTVAINRTSISPFQMGEITGGSASFIANPFIAYAGQQLEYVFEATARVKKELFPGMISRGTVTLAYEISQHPILSGGGAGSISVPILTPPPKGIRKAGRD